MNIKILEFYCRNCKKANIAPTWDILKEFGRVWKDEFKLK